MNGRSQALTGCFYNVKLKTALPLASLSMPIRVSLRTYILQWIRNYTRWIECGLVERSHCDIATTEQLWTVQQGVPSTSHHPPLLLWRLQDPSKPHTKPCTSIISCTLHVHHFNMSWRVNMLSSLETYTKKTKILLILVWMQPKLLAAATRRLLGRNTRR